jgi:hypothetical protein
MYIFANNDSLYFNNKVTTFHFTRYELNTGLRMDLRFDKINFYAAIGFSTRNNITFYSEKTNAKFKGLYRTYFYINNPKPTLFFNLGLVLKLGNARSVYNNKNIYDALDLNSYDGLNKNNTQIPISPKTKMKNSNIESVQDLIDYNDL